MKNNDKGGTKTLRLTVAENDHLNRIMEKLNVSTASKAIPMLFDIFDKKEKIDEDYRLLQIKYNQLRSDVRRMQGQIQTGLTGLNEFLALGTPANEEERKNIYPHQPA